MSINDQFNPPNEYELRMTRIHRARKAMDTAKMCIKRYKRDIEKRNKWEKRFQSAYNELKHLSQGGDLWSKPQ